MLINNEISVNNIPIIIVPIHWYFVRNMPAISVPMVPPTKYSIIYNVFREFALILLLVTTFVWLERCMHCIPASIIRTVITMLTKYPSNASAVNQANNIDNAPAIEHLLLPQVWVCLLSIITHEAPAIPQSPRLPITSSEAKTGRLSSDTIYNSTGRKKMRRRLQILLLKYAAFCYAAIDWSLILEFLCSWTLATAYRRVKLSLLLSGIKASQRMQRNKRNARKWLPIWFRLEIGSLKCQSINKTE